MEGKKVSVLVLAPGMKTRGGITAVVRSYQLHNFWAKWSCRWIETHSDRGPFQKLAYFISSFFKYLYFLPSYDLVHIHFSEPVSAIRKTFFLIPALLFRKKIILHFHSFSPDTTINSRFRPLYRWMFDKADAVIVLSETWRKHVQSISRESLPIQIIFNPAFETTSGPEEREHMILFAGTLNARKGYSDLIRAFSMISGRHPDWNLVLAGNGETEQAASLSQMLGVSDRVKIPGWVSGVEKERLFSRAALFCLPSYAEGFPMAVIDAMAHAIPVVSTPVGGITDVFKDREDLLLISPGRVYELAGKLDMMIRYPHLRHRLAGAAGNKIHDCFRLDVIAAQLDDLYEQLYRRRIR